MAFSKQAITRQRSASHQTDAQAQPRNYLAPTFDESIRSQGAVPEIFLIAQLIAFMPGEDFQDGFDSRPPAGLCGLYETGMIGDSMLPRGRATDPCQGVDDPSLYIPK